MSIRLSFVALVFVSLCLLHLTHGQDLVEQSQTRLIVVLLPTITLLTDTLQNILLASVNGRLLHTYSNTFQGFALEIPDKTGYLTAIATLLANGNVECVIPDTLGKIHQVHTSTTTTISIKSQSVALLAGEAVPTGVRRIESADVDSAAATPTVNIAILDTGIDFTHPDLPTAVTGINVLNKTAPAQDDNGHGTATAGVIAAQNNGLGIIGVAPGAKLYAVKVADSNGYAWNSDVIMGLEWVAQNRAKFNLHLASMSIGFTGLANTPCGLDPLHLAVTALYNRNILLVVSAGNNHQPIQTAIPASYSEVLVATAMTDLDGLPGGLGSPTLAALCSPGDIDDTVASYSNWNIGHADNIIAAPGTCIYSTYLQSSGLSYMSLSGTSFSAPHVAGVVALCFTDGQCVGKSPSQIKSLIIGAANANAVTHTAYGFTGSNDLTYYGPLLYSKAF